MSVTESKPTDCSLKVFRLNNKNENPTKYNNRLINITCSADIQIREVFLQISYVMSYKAKMKPKFVFILSIPSTKFQKPMLSI
ncbi:hypothetical protein GCM10027442_29530 [Emticicia fontis]